MGRYHINRAALILRSLVLLEDLYTSLADPRVQQMVQEILGIMRVRVEAMLAMVTHLQQSPGGDSEDKPPVALAPDPIVPPRPPKTLTAKAKPEYDSDDPP